MIKPSVLLLSALVGLSSYSIPVLANESLADSTSSVADSTASVTTKSDLIIVKFRDASSVNALAAYHASQTKGSYISAEQFAQAQSLLQTLSNAYGAKFSIARIARLGAVVFKLSEQVELGELNSRLKSRLTPLDIVKYAEADPYLSVNALQSLDDDFNLTAESRRLDYASRGIAFSYLTPASTPYWTHVEPGQEDLIHPQVESWGNQRVQADQLSDAAADNLTVCIIDSGYDKYHEDLPQNNVTGSALPHLGDWADEYGHGTHVAGIIAALDNQYGSKGVLPNGRINLNIKRVLDANNSLTGVSSAMSSLADTAYDCAEEGANVISISMTGYSAGGQYGEETFQAAYNKNVLIVAANGNDGIPYGHAYPASFPSVIATGSINIDNGISQFSNQLDETELVAPGSGIYSTMPVGREFNKYYSAEFRINGELYPYSSANVRSDSPEESLSVTAKLIYCDQTTDCRPEEVDDSICISLRVNGYCHYGIDPDTGGLDSSVSLNPAHIIVLHDFESGQQSSYTSTFSISYLEKLNTLMGQTVTLEREFKSIDGYSYAHGTSMATPYVSGVAALAWSNNLACTAGEVRTALSATAKDLGEEGWDAAYGNGLVQAKDASDYMAEHCAAYQEAKTYPIGDSYVRDGQYADTNFGLQGSLDMKSIYDGTGWKRKVLVKFDNSAHANLAIQNATLRFYAHAVNNDPTRMVRFYDTATTWDESTVTWNNAPSAGNFIGEVEVINTTGEYRPDTSGTWYELDITDYLIEHQGDDSIALLLQNEKQPSSAKNNIGLSSRESAYPMEIIVNR